MYAQVTIINHLLTYLHTYTTGVKVWSGRRKTNSRKVGLNVGRKRQHYQERISWIIKLNICHYV